MTTLEFFQNLNYNKDNHFQEETICEEHWFSSGGGSRGAYEIGAWQAFSELGVRFQAVYGASAGAINAALFAQGDLEKASRLWENINIKQLMNAEDEDFAIDSMISRKRDVIPFLIENAKHLQVDTAPMEAFLNAHLDEGAVRASGIDLGVMTVRVPQLSPAPMRLRDMEPGTLSNWVIASASCFPVFPMRKIDGDRYVDGGYFDNMPIDMAIADGADEIVAVDIHPQPTHPEYSRMPFLKMIHPRQSGRLSGFQSAAAEADAPDGLLRHDEGIWRARWHSLHIYENG